MQILGTHLGTKLRAEVLAAFVHRFTGDHKPSWANKPMPNGNPYPLQFASDEDWLAHTYFEITKQGELSRKVTHCTSTPTWPNNPELRGEVA